MIKSFANYFINWLMPLCKKRKLDISTIDVNIILFSFLVSKWGKKYL